MVQERRKMVEEVAARSASSSGSDVTHVHEAVKPEGCPHLRPIGSFPPDLRRHACGSEEA